ncbi:hypothetical protein [Streptomyces sp. NPDC088360]|uniref:hypothetical protein n=1 Tax=Streptomyces sp. NPDC088360 TaxID=3154515 RepID=UPI00344F990B
MTEQTLNIDELLTKWGEAYRAALPQLTPEEKAQREREFWDRLNTTINTRLDAANITICRLCHRERPRQPGEPRYYPSIECRNVRQPWHYHRDWTRGPNQKEKQREARRHRRRIRRGRLPRVPTPNPA